MEINYSKETLKLAELCWSKDGLDIRCTSVRVNETYHDHEGVKYKISEFVFQELMDYQDKAEKKFRVKRFGNVINLIGVR